MHYIPTSHLYNKCHYSHLHSTNFDFQNSHSMNVNFDQLHHIPNAQVTQIWRGNVQVWQMCRECLGEFSGKNVRKELSG